MRWPRGCTAPGPGVAAAAAAAAEPPPRSRCPWLGAAAAHGFLCPAAALLALRGRRSPRARSHTRTPPALSLSSQGTVLRGEGRGGPAVREGCPPGGLRARPAEFVPRRISWGSAAGRREPRWIGVSRRRRAPARTSRSARSPAPAAALNPLRAGNAAGPGSGAGARGSARPGPPLGCGGQRREGGRAPRGEVGPLSSGTAGQAGPGRGTRGSALAPRWLRGARAGARRPLAVQVPRWGRARNESSRAVWTGNISVVHPLE